MQHLPADATHVLLEQARGDPSAAKRLLRLVDRTEINWQGRAHFLALAAQAMRRVLVDYAYRKRRLKRGSGSSHGQVVMLRFFAGLSGKETAHVLGVTERTVKNDWSMARAWLLRELDG